jgi:multidrug transporter EmrE-like cation transporter
MNWIILIIAGLFETAFATCLGKAKEALGTSYTYWMIGFIVCLTISMLLLIKPHKHYQLVRLMRYGRASVLRVLLSPAF